MKDLIIVGAGGFGREIAWLSERMNEASPTWNLLGFIDDNPDFKGKMIGGYSVLGGCGVSSEYPNAWYVCAIGCAVVRRKIVQKINSLIPARYATLIDPSTLISKRVSVGEGCIICAGNIITTDITIGNHVIVNLDCTIGHDAIIEDFVTLYPSVNVSGTTTINSCTEIGTGAQIIQGRRIESNTIIGAGAVVVDDIRKPGTYVGVPAKKIK